MIGETSITPSKIRTPETVEANGFEVQEGDVVGWRCVNQCALAWFTQPNNGCEASYVRWNGNQQPKNSIGQVDGFPGRGGRWYYLSADIQ